MKVIASFNPNSAIRRESSSGGVFSQLAESVIARGGVVYGAVFDENWKVIHTRADNIKDLSKMRGSKYVFSNFVKSIDEAAKDLNEGKYVLFSGTPCQIATVKKKFGENNRLLLVEVVCHGAPEAKYWERYLNEICQKEGCSLNDIESITFRDKRTGWKKYSFTIHFKNGKIFSQLGYDNLYMRAFLQNYTLRDACFKCPFKYPHGSKADITLGDFWGIEKIYPDIDDNIGTTIVIGNTEFGKKNIYNLLAMADFKLSDIIPYNQSISTSAVKPHKYNQFNDDANNMTSMTDLFRKYVGDGFTERFKRIIKYILSSCIL